MNKIICQLVDIDNETIRPASFSIESDRIQDVKYMEDVPADAPYALPGFIDAHVHIESSMMLPGHFAREALRHGTVAAVADPHEIANVLGIEGVKYMIDDTKGLPFHFRFGAPSCVPSTSFETSGAVLGPKEVEELLQSDEIGFLCEMMNYPGVLNGDKDVMAKIEAAKRAGKPIDGHAPGLSGEDLHRYASAGISTDHECDTLQEAEAAIAEGISILIREGSAAKNFEALSPLLTSHSDSVMFCTDDCHPDKFRSGHIESLVRRAVAKGYPLWNVLRAACLNPAEHYGLPVGRLREGDSADFILVDNLKDFNILGTCIKGQLFSIKNKMPKPPVKSDPLPNKFFAEHISAGDIKTPEETGKIKIITASNGSLLTGYETGYAGEEDTLKIIVLNRYESKAKPAIGYIRGFRLERGAIASSVAHDSHNIIAIGTSDESIAEAVNALVDMRGGLVVCDSGKTVAMPLPIAGLMSEKQFDDVQAEYEAVRDAAKGLGCPFDDPFMTMSFMALPVIPALKMTDLGLFDCSAFFHTSLCVK